MNDCRFGVSPVNYPDPDPDPEKMYIKSDIEEILFKLATNDHSDKAFLLTSKVWP